MHRVLRLLVQVGGQHAISLLFFLFEFFEFLFHSGVLFFDLLLLLFVVENLFKYQICVHLLARVLNLESLLLVLELAMLFVQLLSHVRHKLERLVKRLFTHVRVLIVLLLFLRVVL